MKLHKVLEPQHLAIAMLLSFGSAAYGFVTAAYSGAYPRAGCLAAIFLFLIQLSYYVARSRALKNPLTSSSQPPPWFTRLSFPTILLPFLFCVL
jgi:hypothetical protein